MATGDDFDQVVEQVQLDPALLDPSAPGPTLDHGLLERIAQNPELVAAINQNEDVARVLERDPTSIEQIEQDLGLAQQSSFAEPGDVAELAGVTDPSLAEPPVPQEQDKPDPHDLGDLVNP
jgi:hypothetical protein